MFCVCERTSYRMGCLTRSRANLYILDQSSPHVDRRSVDVCRVLERRTRHKLVKFESFGTWFVFFDDDFKNSTVRPLTDWLNGRRRFRLCTAWKSMVWTRFGLLGLLSLCLMWVCMWFEVDCRLLWIESVVFGRRSNYISPPTRPEVTQNKCENKNVRYYVDSKTNLFERVSERASKQALRDVKIEFDSTKVR